MAKRQLSDKLFTAKIVVEFKNQTLSRPKLDGIVGAASRTNPDAREIIVRCREATKPALKAAAEGMYNIVVSIIKNKKVNNEYYIK